MADSIERTFAYDAFLSYSHAADHELAPVLQSHMQSFAKPWYKLRSMRIFRDETTLSATPHLWPDIRKAIDDAKYFILLASPLAAHSRWVQQEISHWITTRGSDTLLIVLTEGVIEWDDNANDFDWTLTTALPQVLKNAYRSEPKWEDVSALTKAEDLNMQNPILRKTVASLYSSVTGKPLDTVIGEDVRQYRRTRMIGWSVFATLISVFVGTLWLYLYYSKLNELEQIKVTQQRAERIRANSRHIAEEARQFVERGDAGFALNLVLEDLENNPDDPGPRPTVAESHMTLFAGLHSNIENNIMPAQGQADIVAFSSKSQVLAASDRTVLIFDQGTNAPRRRLVHDGKVVSADFSSDGQRVLTASRDRSARIWELNSEAVKQFQHDGEVLVAIFAPTEALIATGSRDKTAAIWDVASGQRRLSLPHESDVNDIAWLEGGKRALTLTGQGVLRAWDLATGAKLFEGQAGRMVKLGRIRVSPDGTRAVTFGGSGPATLWDTKDGTVVGKLSHGGRSHVTSATFSPRDDLIVTTGSDQRTAMWDSKRGQLIYTLLDHYNVVSGASFSPDGSRMVTFSQDRTAIVYAACDGRELATLRGHADEVVSAGFSADGCSVVTGSGDATVRQWKLLERPGQTILAEQKCTPGLARRGSDLCRAQSEFASLRRELLAATISNDAKWVATAGLDRIARVYNAETGERTVALPMQSQPIRTVAFNTKGDILLTGQGQFNPPGQPGILRIWDWRSGKELIPNGITHSAAVQSVSFNHDDTRILTASGDGLAQIFDAKTGELILKLETGLDCNQRRCWLGSAAWSPDGSHVATASFGGKACIWEIAGKTGVIDVPSLCVSHKSGQPVYSVNWNSRGSHVVTGGGDNQAVVWDARSGEAVRRFVGETFDFRMVSFFDNDRQIISANDDYSVRFWFAGTGRELARLSHRQSFINAAMMDKSGQRLLTASADGIARIWWLPPTMEDLADAARKSLRRCLSGQQRGEYNLTNRDLPHWCDGKLYGPNFGRVTAAPPSASAGQ